MTRSCLDRLEENRRIATLCPPSCTFGYFGSTTVFPARANTRYIQTIDHAPLRILRKLINFRSSYGTSLKLNNKTMILDMFIIQFDAGVFRTFSAILMVRGCFFWFLVYFLVS
eukprot:GHVU01047559.1.p2 GENE.GHVU01047559.1~~GHVU01047559.1.p2  ORF type:complete len:113 (-),score=3.68 GHVU01047559.1:3626-3964(-)